MLAASDLRRFDVGSYRSFDTATLLQYLADRDGMPALLGEPSAVWEAREFGDGNLNLVFLVTGATGSVVVKQALPYVRMVGPSWPLSLLRSHFEYYALAEQRKWAAGLVPKVYQADLDMALIVMEHLASHTVVRKGLIAGHAYPLLGRHLGEFLAQTLFYTSDFHLSAEEKRLGIARFAGNIAMGRITEDLVFDEPYFDAPLNRHTAPMLDGIALAFRRDTALKLAVQQLKGCFLNRPECLLHGDLHTGSIMATADDTRIIDPEFACFGPMGFDLGVLLANLLIAFLSQSARAPAHRGRHDQGAYLRDQIALLWSSFADQLSQLWGSRPETGGQSALFNRRLSVDAQDLELAALQALLRRIWTRAVGFAGCEMIRRILGLAHVEDFEILDPSIRGEREIATLCLARDMLLQRQNYPSVQELLAAAETHA